MTRDQATDLLKSYLPEYLLRTGRSSTRAFTCLNPAHEDSTPSMSYDKNQRRCHCFGCHANYDIFDIIGLDYGLTSDREKFDMAYRLFNITVDGTPVTAPPARKENKVDHIDYSAYIKKAQAAFPGSPAESYLKGRGIAPETARKYGIGYAERHWLKTGATMRCVVLPLGEHSYNARNIDKCDKGDRFRKGKGQEPGVFNISALYGSAGPVFVTEGEIDALSIIECGSPAVGLSSADNVNALLNLVAEKRPAQTLILCMDDDAAGDGALVELMNGTEKQKGLKDLKVPFYRYNVAGEKNKDPNEALQADREAFAAEIAKAIAEKEKRLQEEDEALQEEESAARAEYMARSCAGQMAAFREKLATNASTPPISTGYEGLDAALKGGLRPGLYLLGAGTSIGKTAFLLQMADSISCAGRHVLYFSLEMGRYELMARSISRLSFMHSDKLKAKTTWDILDGKCRDQYLIRKAMDSYLVVGKNMFIDECQSSDQGDAEHIRAAVENHITITGERPVVFVDYLQIMRSSDPRLSDKQAADRNVLALKQLSRDLELPVVAVASFNRDQYKKGSDGHAHLSSFKESGGIEYSCDVAMFMEFAAAGADWSEQKEEAQRKEAERAVTVKVAKNRNGPTGDEMEFKYYAPFSYFEETGRKSGDGDPKQEDENLLSIFDI